MTEMNTFDHEVSSSKGRMGAKGLAQALRYAVAHEASHRPAGGVCIQDAKGDVVCWVRNGKPVFEVRESTTA